MRTKIKINAASLKKEEDDVGQGNIIYLLETPRGCSVVKNVCYLDLIGSNLKKKNAREFIKLFWIFLF